MKATSKINLSRSALKQNLDFLRKVIGKEVIICSVIKGNAYGHGIEKFVPLAEECGIKHFAVFSADEAIRTLNASTYKPMIMIMGMIDNQELKWAIKNEIEYFVFELDRLEKSIEIAKKIGKKARVHIELETGMNRTGFPEKDQDRVIELIKLNRQHINFRGLCTHYAGAESIANYVRIIKQIKRYRKFYWKFVNESLEPDLRHTACSAASMIYPRTRMDMVRIGIMQYGYWSSNETKINFLAKKGEKMDPLRRIISWKSKVMSVKNVKKGDFIGYGNSFLAQDDLKIATVPVGYSHGFSRSLSNRGRVLINGFRVSVIGTVNMNMLVVNVTDLENIKKGDTVVMIGEQKDLSISVASFSEFSNQLNYELLTRLPLNIPRIIVK